VLISLGVAVALAFTGVIVGSVHRKKKLSAQRRKPSDRDSGGETHAARDR
jgi:hypothetical protein